MNYAYLVGYKFESSGKKKVLIKDEIDFIEKYRGVRQLASVIDLAHEAVDKKQQYIAGLYK